MWHLAYDDGKLANALDWFAGGPDRAERAEEIMEALQPLLDQLPPIEADVARLRIHGLTQQQIGNLFRHAGMLPNSQGGVCYVERRAREMMQFLRVRGPLPGNAKDLHQAINTEIDDDGRPIKQFEMRQCEVLLDWLRTTCAAETGRSYGMNQSQVYHVILKSITRAKKSGARDWLRVIRLTKEHSCALHHYHTHQSLR